MKGIDMRGTKWGRLTIPEDAIPQKKGTSPNWYWPCICDCGNTCLVEGGALRKGHTKSCGCYQRERAAEASLKDLTGQKFNRLTVIEKDNIKKNNYWICQCECGNTTSVRGIDLKRGQVKSCGCLLSEHIKKYNNPPLELTGQKFGKLTVLYQIENNSKGNSMWHCQCECGNFTNVRGGALVRGGVLSCGCLNSIGNMKINKLLQEENIHYKNEYQVFPINSTAKYYKYDFAILDDNGNPIRLIEFDGEQHYGINKSGWNTPEHYEQQIARDQEKNQWAKDHNIPLVRIPYWERDKVTLEMIMGDQYLVK